MILNHLQIKCIEKTKVGDQAEIYISGNGGICNLPTEQTQLFPIVFAGRKKSYIKEGFKLFIGCHYPNRVYVNGYLFYFSSIDSLNDELYYSIRKQGYSYAFKIDFAENKNLPFIKKIIRKQNAF